MLVNKTTLVLFPWILLNLMSVNGKIIHIFVFLFMSLKTCGRCRPAGDPETTGGGGRETETPGGKGRGHREDDTWRNRYLTVI